MGISIIWVGTTDKEGYHKRREAKEGIGRTKKESSTALKQKKKCAGYF